MYFLWWSFVCNLSGDEMLLTMAPAKKPCVWLMHRHILDFDGYVTCSRCSFALPSTHWWHFTAGLLTLWHSWFVWKLLCRQSHCREARSVPVDSWMSAQPPFGLEMHRGRLQRCEPTHELHYTVKNRHQNAEKYTCCIAITYCTPYQVPGGLWVLETHHRTLQRTRTPDIPPTWKCTYFAL